MAKKKEKKEIQTEIEPVITEVNDGQMYTRSVQVSTMHTQVLVSSEDPKDSLNSIKSMVMSLVDKYKT